MKILFVSIGGLADLSENAVYPDLLRCFYENGHDVYVICQREKRTGLPTELNVECGIHVLRVQTGNITKSGLIEKGVSTLLIGSIFKKAIKRQFKGIRFDLVLYTTPPITVSKAVKYIKKRDRAFTYLMLKDIFPQNAVDINILRKKGVKGIIYKYFRHNEKQLYNVSDFIGCMSNANVDYIKRNNTYVDHDKIGLCPNTIDPLIETQVDKGELRKSLSLPSDKIVFVYGGNFGKPQDVDYIIDVLESNVNRDDCHFIMCGSGTDFYKIKEYAKKGTCSHITVIDSLNKQKYEQLLEACDVGLLFLDHRFTIPNFPSRILDYMNHKLPVLAATDLNTDIGKVITEGGFGWSCESNNIADFNIIVDEILANRKILTDKGIAGRRYLEKYYHTKVAYDSIVKAFDKHAGKKLGGYNHVS